MIVLSITMYTAARKGPEGCPRRRADYAAFPSNLAPLLSCAVYFPIMRCRRGYSYGSSRHLKAVMGRNTLQGRLGGCGEIHTVVGSLILVCTASVWSKWRELDACVTASERLHIIIFHVYSVPR